MNDNIKFAFCWYQRDEWEALKATATDKDDLDDTYDEWKKNANDAIRELREQGQEIQKISMRMDRFVAWCESNGLENNSQARSRYAVEMHKKRTNLRA